MWWDPLCVGRGFCLHKYTVKWGGMLDDISLIEVYYLVYYHLDRYFAYDLQDFCKVASVGEILSL